MRPSTATSPGSTAKPSGVTKPDSATRPVSATLGPGSVILTKQMTSIHRQSPRPRQQANGATQTQPPVEYLGTWCLPPCPGRPPVRQAKADRRCGRPSVHYAPLAASLTSATHILVFTLTSWKNSILSCVYSFVSEKICVQHIKE